MLCWHRNRGGCGRGRAFSHLLRIPRAHGRMSLRSQLADVRAPARLGGLARHQFVARTMTVKNRYQLRTCSHLGASPSRGSPNATRPSGLSSEAEELPSISVKRNSASAAATITSNAIPAPARVHATAAMTARTVGIRCRATIRWPGRTNPGIGILLCCITLMGTPMWGGTIYVCHSLSIHSPGGHRWPRGQRVGWRLCGTFYQATLLAGCTRAEAARQIIHQARAAIA